MPCLSTAPPPTLIHSVQIISFPTLIFCSRCWSHLEIFCFEFFIFLKQGKALRLLHSGQLDCSGCLSPLSPQPEKVTPNVVAPPPPWLSSHQACNTRMKAAGDSCSLSVRVRDHNTEPRSLQSTTMTGEPRFTTGQEWSWIKQLE